MLWSSAGEPRTRGRDRLIGVAIVAALTGAVMGHQDSGFAEVEPGPASDLTAAVAAADEGSIDPTFGEGGHFYATTILATGLTWWGAARCVIAPDCEVYPVDTSAGAMETQGRAMDTSLSTAAAVAEEWARPVSKYTPAPLDGMGDVSGPSAGLMTALAFIDAQTDGDLTGGLTVAGTGTVDLEGNVGRIGGIEHKVIGAHTAGASVFLAPAPQAREASQAAPMGLQVVAVDSVRDAVEWLCAHGGQSQVCG